MLILRIGAVMSNSLCSNELGTKRCFGERQRRAHPAGLWLARIAAGVAGPQRAIGANAKCAAPVISYTRADQARHVLCRSLRL